MNRYEKTRLAIDHKVSDGIPSCIHLDDEARIKYMDPLAERYMTHDMEMLWKEGKISREHAIYYSMGNHVLGVTCPWWDWFNLPPEYDEDDAPDFLPQTIGKGSYEAYFEQVENLKKYTDAYVVVLIWGSHFEKAYFARGIENFLADLAGDPDYAGELLNFIIHKNLVMLENIVNVKGPDGILLGSDWGSQKDLLMSPNVWRELIRPGEEKEYKLIKEGGKDVWIHSCGDIERIMPDLAEMKIDVLNPLQPECMDIYKLKENFGSQIAFWGGVSTQEILPFGTPEDVRNETIKVAEALSQNGGYITAPSQEIQKDVPFENLCALIDTAKELAR